MTSIKIETTSIKFLFKIRVHKHKYQSILWLKSSHPIAISSNYFVTFFLLSQDSRVEMKKKIKFEIKIKNSKIKGTKCIFIHLLNSEHGKIKVVNYYQCHIWYIFFNFIYFNNSKLSHVKSACH